MCPPTVLIVAAPVAGLATYCVIHLAMAKFCRNQSPYLALVGAFVPGLLCTIVATVFPLRQLAAGGEDWAGYDGIGYLVLNVATYAALGWCYFHFVNLGIASLRIRILEELVDAGGAMSGARLASLYDDQAVIAARLQRLRAGGHLVEHEGRYKIGRQRFLFVAKIFDGLHALIFGSQRAGGAQP